MLKGRKIIIGISGGIAAYKCANLIRLFKKAGAEVKVIATANALEFITRTTLETLSGNAIYDSVFGLQNDYSTEHIAITDWGDIFIIAPATANCIGKFANGIADDALSTSFMAFNKPVFIAPAMNVKMFEHFAFQKNLNTLKENNIHIIEPSDGFLACGYEGKGRMEEPEKIFETVNTFLNSDQPLKGKKILVTAGPTFEPIDPVRFIGNHSSGKMGFALAENFAKKGAEVILISGPVALTVKNHLIQRINIVTAEQMKKECLKYFKTADITVMAAAVADYSPTKVATQKIKKSTDIKSIELKPTADILGELGKLKKSGQLLIGFALETEHEQDNAKTKLVKKNLDFIVLNSLQEKGAGFGYDTNKISVIHKTGKPTHFELKSKEMVAEDIVSVIVNKYLKSSKNA